MCLLLFDTFLEVLSVYIVNTYLRVSISFLRLEVTSQQVVDNKEGMTRVPFTFTIP